MNNIIKFNNITRRSVAFFSLLTFLTAQLVPFSAVEARAQSVLSLPSPGAMVGLTSGFLPPVLKGMSVDLQQPFQFDFIFDSGQEDFKEDQIKEEAQRLIRYFLASLTMPEDDLWVNLSPYEKERIIPAEFGKTEMGRDLLAQDYLLKQLTASLIYPEEDLGKEFWERVNAKASQLYGTIEVPVNTFNKVWIVPEKAVVYEENGTVFVLESRLKVMLEEDYVAVKEALTSEFRAQSKTNELTKFQTEVMREIIIPEIEREVNDGRQFAKLRQIYHSLILAKWYKERLKTSLLNQAYADQRKISGVDLEDPLIAQKIYEQYLEAFKVGVFDYIKEDYDPSSQETIPRKYFSGGLELKVPLEVTRSPSKKQLASIGSKLTWIKGIYRQPRASARSVNDFIRTQFAQGNVRAGQPIVLEDGTIRKAYYVDGLLQEMGQLGHIGFIEKDEKGNAIEGGLEVVFLDSKYGANSTVRNHEAFKVGQWTQKRQELRLLPSQMRQWLRENLQEAAAFLQRVDEEASRVHPIEEIYVQAQRAGEMASGERIAETYRQVDDFEDLNLAAGRWGLPQDSVYRLTDSERYDDIVINELAKQRGVSVDDLEADFERNVTMLEERIEHTGFIDPQADVVAKKLHEIFGRLIAVYQTKTDSPVGRFHVIDANSVNAFVIRNRLDVYFYKGLYETLYDISVRMGVPLTEDMIAFIIAHELAHALQHTSHEGLNVRDLDEKTSPYLVQMIKNGEYDADMLALELMDKAGCKDGKPGYSVFGAIDAMTFLEFITGSSQAEDVLSSHPFVSLRKHRLSSIIMDQKTNVFVDVQSSRTPMPGQGRIKSQDVDFRHIMDKGEAELLEMAEGVESLVELEELVGILVFRKRMNALKSLVHEEQLKTAFLRHVYLQAVFSMIKNYWVVYHEIDYADMRGAAAIFDFGEEIAEGRILSQSAGEFDENIDEVFEKTQKKLLESSIQEDAKGAKRQLIKLFDTIRRKANALDDHDFAYFLLPRGEVEHLIPIFKKESNYSLENFLEGGGKDSADRRLIEEGIRNPRKLISAFFYANYLDQTPSIEFGIPTTDVRVNLRRKANALYQENPAYQNTQTAQDRQRLQNIILLHYITQKSRNTVESRSLNYSFPGINRFLGISPQAGHQLFKKYYGLMLKSYPAQIAFQLASRQMEKYFNFSVHKSDIPEIWESGQKIDWKKEFSAEWKKAASEYSGTPERERDYIRQRMIQFLDRHQIIIFIKGAIKQYGDRMAPEIVSRFHLQMDQWILGDFNDTNVIIEKIVEEIIEIHAEDPPRMAWVSEVFLEETKLNYYRAGWAIRSFRSLAGLPDWAVSDYLNQHSYQTRSLIDDALSTGASIEKIFDFMKTRLTYADRQTIFQGLVFDAYDQKFAGLVMDFFEKQLKNDPKEIVLWFLGMFSRNDALKFIEKFSMIILHSKVQAESDSQRADQLRELTIALFEYVFRQTSRNFHADNRSVKFYLELIRQRIDASGRAEDELYVNESVYHALSVLSSAVGFDLAISRPQDVSREGTPDFKSKTTSILSEVFDKVGLKEKKRVEHESHFSLHYFGWNEDHPTSQSIFVSHLIDLSIEQLKDLLKSRKSYIESQTDLEYRGEGLSYAAKNDFFANLITFIILKKMHNPSWGNNEDHASRLDDLFKIDVLFSKDENETKVDIYFEIKFKENAAEIRSIAYEAIRTHLVGVVIPSNTFDSIWKDYIETHSLQGSFPEFFELLQNPNMGNESLYSPIKFLERNKYWHKVSYRQIVQKFFMGSSVYSHFFNKYIQLHGAGYVYGDLKSLEERLEWLERVLPNKSIIRDGILDRWEVERFPEIIAHLPVLVRLALEASGEKGGVKDMWTLLGEMDDDVGRLNVLNQKIILSPDKIVALLDFYLTIIPLTLSPQKIARYGATAYVLWTQLPGNADLGLPDHLEALEKFMPEPSVLRDEMLMKISNRYVRHLEDGPRVSEMLYANNLLSPNKDLRTEDFVTETLLHLFGAAKIEDRRDILLWIVGVRDKPAFIIKAEDEYNIDFTTLPSDVKLLPATMREKFIEGFMLGDNGVLDPQNNADRAVMDDFLTQLFAYIFPQGAQGMGDETRLLLSKVFLVVMKAYQPYRRVQIIKALAALRVRADFENTSIGERLSILLGVLGPVGIKVAQYLSENETLVPNDDMRSSLGSLRNKAPEITKISVISVLTNEVPLADRVISDIGELAGVASMGQVNRGKWLDVEALAEIILKKTQGAEADQLRKQIAAYRAGRLSFAEFARDMLQQAEAYGIDKSQAVVSVVYKVRRPNIETTLGFDYIALDAVARELEGETLDGEALNIGDLVQTVKEWVTLEKDFMNEASFHHDLAELDYTWAGEIAQQAGVDIVHPRIFYATEALIVEEEIQGSPILSLAERQQPITIDDVLGAGYTSAEAEHIFARLVKGDSRQAHLRLSLKKSGFSESRLDALTKQMMSFDYGKLRGLFREMLLHQIFVDGVFHADLHQGNVLLSPDGKLSMIDFGNIGKLNPEQIAGAKILLKGLALRQGTLIKEGINAMFLNAAIPDGGKAMPSKITDQDIQEILDKGYDLKMTMNMISVKAVEGAKSTQEGKDFSTFLKAFTQAMWLFPTDLKNGIDTLTAIVKYISLTQEETVKAAVEQAKYFVFPEDVASSDSKADQGDLLSITKRLFNEMADSHRLSFLWRKAVWRMMAGPLKVGNARMISLARSNWFFLQAYAQRLMESRMDELVKRQDSDLLDVARDMVSVELIEQFVVEYLKNARQERAWVKVLSPVAMPLLRGGLFLARPFTRIYVDAAKEWIDRTGRRHLGQMLPNGTLSESVDLLAQVLPQEFAQIKEKFDEAKRKVASVRSDGRAGDRQGARRTGDDFQMGDAGDRDRSMGDGIRSSIRQNPGGIDFNPNLLELQIEGDGMEFSVPAYPINVDQILIDGLMPVIISITPVTTLPVIFGAADRNDELHLSAMK